LLTKNEVRELFRAYAEATSEVERAAAREKLVDQYIGLVEFLARRFRNRGELLEDLVQVGTIGLLKAIDRFELEREVEFSTYATPTIVGEIKRHFRDKGWAVRVPRRLQELHLELTKVIGSLGQELGRSPTVNEIAEAANLAPEMAKLPERERRILYLRFYRGMTQSEIAARLGISQMHVSRLLNRTLSQLRQALED
jgi:RNA polymerase sigma-B factor